MEPVLPQWMQGTLHCTKTLDPKPQTLNTSFHGIFHYPYITPILYLSIMALVSSFHFIWNSFLVVQDLPHQR